MREIGVETGGSNVQFAVNPEDGRVVVIEMNPRVSRSSALASKATGFPIAKIAAKLAIGYTLDELSNDITRETPACFEPTIDYVVTKIPRFAFEKFALADNTLGTQMKSVGETMSIGRTFKQSIQKALRSLEIGRFGFGGDGKDGPFESVDDETLEKNIRRPTDARLFYIRAAFRRGWTVERVHKLCRIDPWFLRHFEELAAYEDEIRSAGDLEGLQQDQALFRQAKEFGYSDRQIAYLLKSSEDEVRRAREDIGLLPSYGLVDTCAAEFAAYTPYFYSTYGRGGEADPSDREKIMIIGGGPNRIGQGIEFDYCCVHASFALRDAGYETIMVNSNPETVSTDYDTSDRLYFEPLTLEDVLHIYRREQCAGVIVQFGGQTPLNLAQDLENNGVNVLGTKPANIEAAEDRKFFQALARDLGILQPENGMASSADQAAEIAESVGYPVLLRPSFVLGGRAMVIVHDEEALRKYMAEAVQASEQRPVLVDRYLDNAVEVDVDCISDGETSTIGAIMEHVEQAGVHSGDSACMIPTASLSESVKSTIQQHTFALAKALKVCGLMNIQFAVKDEEVYILEVNPRASRTVPFVSKAIGVPLAKLAALVMVGRKLKDIGFTEEIIPEHFSVKEAVFPFARFPGIDVLLSPEMKSTGEVMGIDSDHGVAFMKSQMAANNPVPSGGNVFISVRDFDKSLVIGPARQLISFGFKLFATKGTRRALAEQGVASESVLRIAEGVHNILNLIQDGQIQWIVNTPSSTANARLDETKMRVGAVIKGIPITTTVAGFAAAVAGLGALRKLDHRISVKSLQEFHPNALKLNFEPVDALPN
ncbi:MAG: carbamoyl-phosphate synthase large subunit, partial [Verrucomicrobia bacterium]|nr:carbamoyl-phosphate synthase large subunit [Verrucomicrobiota bacterium]